MAWAGQVVPAQQDVAGGSTAEELPWPWVPVADPSTQFFLVPGNLVIYLSKYVVVVRRLEGLRSGSPFVRHRLTFVIPFCCRNYLAGLRRNLFSTLVCLPEFDSFAVAVPRSSILDPCAVRQNRPSSPMSSSPAQQVDFREPSLVLAIPLCRQLGIRVV